LLCSAPLTTSIIVMVVGTIRILVILPIRRRVIGASSGKLNRGRAGMKPTNMWATFKPCSIMLVFTPSAVVNQIMGRIMICKGWLPMDVSFWLARNPVTASNKLRVELQRGRLPKLNDHPSVLSNLSQTRKFPCPACWPKSRSWLRNSLT